MNIQLLKEKKHAHSSDRVSKPNPHHGYDQEWSDEMKNCDEEQQDDEAIGALTSRIWPKEDTNRSLSELVEVIPSQ